MKNRLNQEKKSMFFIGIAVYQEREKFTWGK